MLFSSYSFLIVILATVAFAILAPIIGCLLAGLERIISARMQGRVGPPILQPYYDVRKLIAKDDVSVSGVDGVYMTCALVFTMFAGGLFFGGDNLLMSAFVITMAALFFTMAAYSSRIGSKSSPFRGMNTLCSKLSMPIARLRKENWTLMLGSK